MHDKVSARMEVHPSVLFRLGQDLITDEIQALLELIKNAYDADSDFAVVRIVTSQGPPDHPNDNGYVQIIDNGHGMTIETLRLGWLTVSNSIKRRMKQDGRTTPGGRIPLGDKGLGRLGAQRLGNRLTIETTPYGSDLRHRLSFDWRDFEVCEQLSDLELVIHTASGSSETGTTITVSDLRNSTVLADILELERSLVKITSPYRGVESFRISASVNGQDLDPFRLEDRLRRAAVIHCDMVYTSDDVLEIDGLIRLNHLRPIKKTDRPEFERICESDGGHALLSFLMDRPVAQDYQLAPADREGWWARFGAYVRLPELKPHLQESNGDLQGSNTRDATTSTPGLARRESSDPNRAPAMASPGPFIGELDFFNFGAGAAERMVGFESVSSLRSQVRDLGGVRVYRDGFNIPIEGDWLGLGEAWTSGGSWHGLRPGNTLGYVELTTRDNSVLIETTDREGFTRTPHHANFMKILQAFVVSANGILEDVGRGWADYRRIMSRSADDDQDLTPRGVASRLSSTLASTPDYVQTLEGLRTRLVTEATAIKNVYEDPERVAAGIESGSAEWMSSLKSLEGGIDAAVAVAEDLQGFMSELYSQRDAGERLQGEFDSLEEQLALTYETMGVGLTAEALSHEIANIVERLLASTKRAERYIMKEHPTEVDLLNYLSNVRGSINALRRQLAHLAPMLRYVRDRKEVLSIAEIVSETESYFGPRWRDSGISLSVTVTNDFALVMNRGKLLQVFDNLLLNSEYWLREELRTGRTSSCHVSITVEGYIVYIEDDGPGVARDIEQSLFEPFTTRKPKGEGRGLGLFISTQLLEADGCHIRLGAGRNKNDRRHIFEIDLSGASSA